VVPGDRRDARALSARRAVELLDAREALMRADNPLAHRGFVLWWIGHFISVVGTQMTWVAIPYQVYELSAKDPLAMGAVGLARAIPMVLMAIAGGVIADVVDRRRLLFVTQSGLLAIAATLAAVTASGVASVPLLYALVGLSGLFVAVDLPARGALLPSLVPREALPRALTLNAWTYQVACLVGPTLAGVVLGFGGARAVYVLDAFSFGAVLIALVALPPAAPRETPAVTPGLRAALEGIRFVWNQRVIRVTMVLDFLETLFADAKFLMPIFARDLLGGTERTLGLLLAAPPAGAALTAFVLAWLPAPRRQGALVVGGVALYGVATVGFGLAESLPFALAMLAITGAADTVSMVVRNTIRQELTPDEMRARMLSVNMVFFVGGPLIGEFEAGVVARVFSPRAAVVSGGAACVISALACLALAPWLWRYERADLAEARAADR
jgi:MFS family permease